MADWISNAIKTNDINLIDSLIPDEQEFLKAMYETKIPDSTVRAQKEMYAQDSFLKVKDCSFWINLKASKTV